MARSQQIENALDTWRAWDAGPGSKPVVLGALQGGRSNHSFLLEANGKKLVLRLNGANSALPAADRSHEHRIWQAASAQGIAPPLLYVDEQHGFLVSAYINNQVHQQLADKPRLVSRALDLLHRCHQLEVDVPYMDYNAHVEKYWQVIEGKARQPDPGLEAQREQMHGFLRELHEQPNPTGLCHHDPVIQNFVGSPERLYLIDWEYALKGLPMMDYAALGVEWGIDSDQLAEHCDATPELVDMTMGFYKYLCRLWEAARD